MNQRELQIWNDAVAACKKAAWDEVQAMEAEASYGMPSPARAIVREIGNLHKSGDDRQKVPGFSIDASNFPSVATEGDT
ncbi:hypothetical protein [Sulfitobacter sp. R18_1]|uniref:hypothetical protein n=1 Tax=Sulfitobacter sp. R18_1 TaxID=2821104 RepID=UPI001ADA5EAC|nr:hypothetical protein [Sulfitobacter sp. R18_1]MBO9428108.1 hypothetical protein [Sulfitobacter sp. R18_1]